MQIKSPCLIDVSHWEIPDWLNLDPQVCGVFMKATQGKFYLDPTFGSSWNGARNLPRGAYHFFEPNDVSAQVENFLTACEDVGAIVAGEWKGELEPVLDAEYQPPSVISRLLGLPSNPAIREKAKWDMQVPHRFLAANKRVVAATRAVAAPAPVPSVSGAQLAAQYKAWLDLVEAELKIKPIIYTSKWMWNYTDNPAWASDYKLWVAQYPFNPDPQAAPAYLPTGWDQWWLWQYSDQAQLQGISGRVDVNVFNGTEQEFDFIYGGGTKPPEPPTEEPMYNATPVSGKSYVNIRANHTTSAADLGDLLAGQIAEGSELWTSGTAEKWLRITKINGQPKDGWVAILSSGVKFCNLTEIEPPATNPSAEVKFTAPDGKVYAGTVELKPQ